MYLKFHAFVSLMLSKSTFIYSTNQYYCEFVFVYSERFYPCTHPAAVVHAAEHGRGVTLFGLGKAHGALGHRAWGRLGVVDLEAGSQDQGVWVVCVPLDQQVHVPFAVNKQVLGPVQIQAQGSCHLLDGALHQLLDLLLSHCATHGEQHGLQHAVLRMLRWNY